MNTAKVDRYAVIGNPVEHSKSPEIHELFADQTGEMISYEKIFAEENKFHQVATEFFKNAGKGLNITVPFKTNAFEFVDEHTNYAKHAGAVNTIILQEHGTYLGANTDGIGLLRDLKKSLRIQIENKSILIIGAGGATQGIVEPLLNEHAAEILIANRTLSKADAIAAQFQNIGDIKTSGIDEIPKKPFDLVLHATSAGLRDQSIILPTEIIGSHTCCYDLIYYDTDTKFMQWCKNCGAEKVADGFGMLLEQAAESFYMWRGKRPDTTMALNYFRPRS